MTHSILIWAQRQQTSHWLQTRGRIKMKEPENIFAGWMLIGWELLMSYRLSLSVSSQLLRDGNLKQRHTRTTRQLRQVDVKRPYIAAGFKPSTVPPTFTLGNQMFYNGYENRVLEPGQDYVFFLLAELNSTGTVSGNTQHSHYFLSQVTAPLNITTFSIHSIKSKWKTNIPVNNNR